MPTMKKAVYERLVTGVKKMASKGVVPTPEEIQQRYAKRKVKVPMAVCRQLNQDVAHFKDEKKKPSPRVEFTNPKPKQKETGHYGK